MIKYNPKSWFQLIFGFQKSDTIRILWKELIYIGLFTLGVAFVQLTYFPYAKSLSSLVSVYSLIGFVISLLLVFRTNTAYDRWWEGRKKWGQMVNDTRNLAIKFDQLDLTDDQRDIITRMIPNFVFASKEHLREGVLIEELELNSAELTEFSHKQHIPAHVVKCITEVLTKLKDFKKVSTEQYLAIDENLNELLNSLGACERIKNTPIPYSYSLFLKKFIFIYVATIPLAFVPTFGYFAALIATFIFYVLVSMEVLAEEIEDPFGTDDNDLPTEELCHKIKANVQEIMQD